MVDNLKYQNSLIKYLNVFQWPSNIDLIKNDSVELQMVTFILIYSKGCFFFKPQEF